MTRIHSVGEAGLPGTGTDVGATTNHPEAALPHEAAALHEAALSREAVRARDVGASSLCPSNGGPNSPYADGEKHRYATLNSPAYISPPAHRRFKRYLSEQGRSSKGGQLQNWQLSPTNLTPLGARRTLPALPTGNQLVSNQPNLTQHSQSKNTSFGVPQTKLSRSEVFREECEQIVRDAWKASPQAGDYRIDPSAPAVTFHSEISSQAVHYALHVDKEFADLNARVVIHADASTNEATHAGVGLVYKRLGGDDPTWRDSNF
ncbi:hypothetical protein F5Y16DRAFT_401445 [Xylariaceae sp. FL0255]|nr:hypothetical protein F5Y16DRAFT_401445 [Xylariaceae sp. FL0255]